MQENLTTEKIRLKALFSDQWWIASLSAASLFVLWVYFTIPALAGDEALTSVDVFHILQGKFQIWSCGYSYSGSLMNFITAPLVALLGNEVWVFRLPSLFYRIAEVVMTSAMVYLLLGRKPAIIGAALAGFWPVRLQEQLFYSTYHGLLAFLIWCAMFFLVCSFHFSNRVLLFGSLCGLFSGLAFWTHPITLTMFLPFAACYFFCTIALAPLWKRISAIFVSFFAGSLPFWYYNLVSTWMGTFHENQVTQILKTDLNGTLTQAVLNWKFYWNDLTQYVFQSLKWMFLIGWITFLVLLVYTCKTKERHSERNAYFWLFAVLGTLTVWMLATGFTGAGSLRGEVTRYMLPVFIVTPLAFSFLAKFQIKRWSIGILLFPFILLPILDLMQTQTRLQQKREARFLTTNVLEKAQKNNVAYILGDYFDVQPYNLLSCGLITAITTDGSTLTFHVPPQDLPPAVTGLLLLKKFSSLEKSLRSQNLLSDLRGNEIGDSQLYTLSPDSKLGVWMSTAINFQWNYKKLQEHKLQELNINPGLRVFQAQRFDMQGADLKLKTNHPKEFLCYGPYIRLPSGKYEVDFVFDPPQPQHFSVITDVVTELSNHTIARKLYNLSERGGTLKSTFTVSKRDRTVYEMRVYLVSTDGWVTLSRTTLRKLR